MPNRETTMSLPPRWGDDPLTDFMKDAFGNILATFVRKPAFRLLIAVDKNYMRIGENLVNPPDFLAAFFILRSHSVFRAACRIAASGQVSETFPLLRSCIEYALYALHVNSNAPLGEVWMRRHDDDAALKLCKKSFKHVDVIATLKQRDVSLYETIHTLYERTIEFGAHPNERAITASMVLEEGADKKTFQSIYLHGDALALDHAIKTTAQTGLGALLMFEHIFRDRFRLLGIDAQLQELRKLL